MPLEAGLTPWIQDLFAGTGPLGTKLDLLELCFLELRLRNRALDFLGAGPSLWGRKSSLDWSSGTEAGSPGAVLPGAKTSQPGAGLGLPHWTWTSGTEAGSPGAVLPGAGPLGPDLGLLSGSGSLGTGFLELDLRLWELVFHSSLDLWNRSWISWSWNSAAGTPQLELRSWNSAAGLPHWSWVFGNWIPGAGSPALELALLTGTGSPGAVLPGAGPRTQSWPSWSWTLPLEPGFFPGAGLPHWSWTPDPKLAFFTGAGLRTQSWPFRSWTPLLQPGRGPPVSDLESGPGLPCGLGLAGLEPAWTTDPELSFN
jgi:hypothetical protein